MSTMSARDIAPFVRFVMRCHMSGADMKSANRLFKTKDCRLFYILSGRGFMAIEGERQALRPGAAILFQSGTEYMWCLESPADSVDYISVNFDFTQNFCTKKEYWFPSSARTFGTGDALERLTFPDAPALDSPVFLARASAAEEPLNSMLGVCLTGADFTEERLSAMMKLVIYQMLDLTRCDQEQSLREQTLAVMVMDYISAHYADPLSNEQLSRIFSFHPVYLNRVVKAFTGRSLHQHIIFCRIRAAGELLQSGNTSVSQAAASVGFTDVDHFSKSFKKATGVAPSRCKNIK